MRSRRLTSIASIAVLVLVGGACGGSGEDGAVGERPATTTSSASSSTATGGPASAAELAFTSPAIGGGTVDGATFQGRPTLLWFWSPW